MAYKFQLGAAKLGGKVTAAGLDAGDADIDNVADIAVVSISADVNDIKMVATHDRGAAFQISGSQGVLLFADTTEDQYRMYAPKGMAFDVDGDTAAVNNSGRLELYASGAMGAGGRAMELAQGLNESFQHFRISGSQQLQLGDNQFRMDRSGNDVRIATQNVTRATFNAAGLTVAGAMAAGTVSITDPSSLAGAALVRNGATLDVGVNSTSFQIASDEIQLKSTSAKSGLEVDGHAIQIASLGVATGKIADDAVTYAKMQNVSATNVILGRDSAGAGIVEEIAPAALRTMINVEDGSTADQTAVEIIGLLNSDLGGNFSIGNQASDSLTLAGALVVGGDLTINGTTTTVNSTTIELDDKNIELAKGMGNDAAVDGGGITLISSAGNKTLNWIDATDSWTSSEHMDLVSGKVFKIAGSEVMSATALSPSVRVDGDSLNISLCGASLSAAAIADADLLIVDDGANGTSKKMTAGDLRTYMNQGAVSKGIISWNGAGNHTGLDATSMGKIFWQTAANGAARTVALPAGDPAMVGKSIVFKSQGATSTNTVTLLRNGSTIDGGTADVLLESDGAAVELYYVDTNKWIIV